MIMTMTMVMSAAMLVAVVPQLGLVEQKEEHQPHQQGGKQLARTGLALKGLGQQVHKGGCQQSTGSQAEHVLGVAGQHPKAQKSGQPDTADTSGQRTDQNCY